MPGPLSVEGKDKDSVLDIEELLSEDDDKETVDKDKKESNKNDKEADESREEDDEGEGDKAEKEEDTEDEEDKIDLKSDEEIEIDAPPRKKELLKAFPDIFKKFPFIEKMLYRDQQYTQMFGSFDEAKEISEKASTLDDYEQQLMSGNSVSLLTDVHQNDPKAFSKIALNILPTIKQIDGNAYKEIVGDLIRRLTHSMHSTGESKKDEDLKTAAALVNGYVFGDEKVEAPKARETEKEDELSKREREFNDRRRVTNVNDISLKVGNTLKNTVSEYIDQKNQMSSFEKRGAIKEVLELVDEEIGRDTMFRRMLDKLWVAAEQDNYSKNSLDRIRSTYLGRAKPLLSSSIKKVRAEILKDKKPTRHLSSKDDDNDDKDNRKGPIKMARPAALKGGKSQMKEGESIDEFFARD